MAQMTPAQITAELQRKAAAGETKASNAANQAQLDSIIKQMNAPKPPSNNVPTPPSNSGGSSYNPNANNLPDTKVGANGQTMYRIGDTYGTYNPNNPNQAQISQMQHQVQNTGTVSDYYAGAFGINNQAPTMNYYTPPKDNKGNIDYTGLAQGLGKNSMNTAQMSDGRLLDTTGWTAQQVHAATLMDEVAAGKRTQENAMAVLSGMGLDRYGNKTIAGYANVPTPSFASGGGSIPAQHSLSGANGVPTPSFNPSYGANVEGFDPNNAQHKQLADAGQQWADAKRRGDQAGMDAAKAIGDQLRAGMGGSSFNAKTGVTSVPTPPMVIEQPKLTGGTAPETPYMRLTPQQINQEASYQINKERADLKNTVDNMIAGVKNNANYATQQIKDTRVLEDAKIGRSLNPFSGRTTYDKAMIGRGRAIDDTYRATNLENELTRIQNDLYNFDKLAPDKQRSLINEMTRMERDYGLQVGQLTGWFGNQRTLAGQQFDWSKDPSNPAVVGQNISNKIAQLQLDNLPAQTKLELQQLEQRAKQGDIDLKTAEWQLNELTNPDSVTNKAKQLELDMKQLEAKNLPEMQRLELQKLRKQIAEIGKEPTVTEYDKKMQEIKLASAQLELEKLQKGDTKSYSNQINSIVDMYVAKDPYTGQMKISNTQSMRNAIIALGMSDEETDKYLIMYGLPINQ